jgi:hypothetical protein
MIEVGVPRKDEKQVEAIIVGFEAEVEALDDDPHAAFSADTFARSNRPAQAYGLTDCVI